MFSAEGHIDNSLHFYTIFLNETCFLLPPEMYKPPCVSNTLKFIFAVQKHRRVSSESMNTKSDKDKLG